MFENLREKEQDRENAKKLLEAKIEDKFQFAISKNKMTHTDFLNMAEKTLAEKFIKEKHISHFLFFGGNGEDSERNILLFYPEKFSQEMVEKNFCKIVCALSIQLPKEVHYEHKIYLGGILKLGIKREKIGDILVRENGADIIVIQEIAEFLKQHLVELTRFQKADCEIISIDEVEHKEKQFEHFSIIVSSMRLDNFVSELARCSRTKAGEILKEQRVLINDAIETKFSRKVNIGDRITIRGKGKFVVQEMEHKTKSEKQVIGVNKFIS